MNEIRKILIADDHSIVSKGLYLIISTNFGNCIITQVNSLETLLLQLPKDDYTHLVLDLNFEDGNSIDILPQVTEKYPALAILIYSMVSEDVYGKMLMRFYNVSGFLSKRATADELLQALQIFLNGGIFISRSLKRQLDNAGGEARPKNVFHSLSVTELKVLHLILKGSKPKQIANELGVLQQTITTYKNRIFKKLGTTNILEIQKLAELYEVSFE